MATRRFLGQAVDVAQVDTLTVGGTVEADDVFSMTINNKTLDVVAGDTDVDTVAATIATAWNALSASDGWQEFAEITAAASGSGGTLTLTGDTKGKPFTVTVATTEDGGGAADAQTFGKASTTAATGRKHWDNADNWSGNTVPVNSDDVVIDIGAEILYGLDQNAVTLTSLTIKGPSSLKIGLPVENEDGSTSYFEYRDTYLKISATTVNVDTASPRIKLNVGSAQCTLNVDGTGSAESTEVHAFIFVGTHASNEINITRGTLDVAPFASETATVATLRQGFQTNQAGDTEVRLSDGVSVTTITKTGGIGDFDSSGGITTLTQTGGECSVNGSAGVTNLAIRGGDCYFNTTGTLGGNPIVSGDGQLVFDRDPQAKTVTNPVELYGRSARLVDTHKVVSSLVVDCNETDAENLTLGTNVRITRGTPA